MCIQKLEILALIEAKKFVTENLLGEKEKWTNKGIISSSKLILFYTIQQVIPNMCNKFQNPRHSNSWEIFDTNFPMYYIRVRDEKRKNGKRRQKLITASCFSFPQYTRSRKICDRNFYWRKKNGQIKGIISRRRVILSYTIQQVIPNICTKFQNPRFSSSWGIFDAKKSLHTHKHIYWKDKNYIPPIYFLYQWYNKETNMQQQPDSSIHDTSAHCPRVY